MTISVCYLGEKIKDRHEFQADQNRSLIIMGNTAGSPLFLDSFFRQMIEKQGPEGQLSTSFLKVMNHTIPTNVSLALGFSGPLLPPVLVVLQASLLYWRRNSSMQVPTIWPLSEGPMSSIPQSFRFSISSMRPLQTTIKHLVRSLGLLMKTVMGLSSPKEQRLSFWKRKITLKKERGLPLQNIVEDLTAAAEAT